MKTLIKLFFIILVTSFIFISCRESIIDPDKNQIEEQKPFVLSLKEIKYPTEKELLKQSYTYEIKWEITPNLDFVKIDLLKKFKKVETISYSTENDGIYRWNIPGNLQGSHHYRIRIAIPNNDYISTQSAEFEIPPLPQTSENIDISN
ncbi:MAG: Ser-Thr-rich GPI-anchored membrane family protein [Melioribacteraceae bacterium]